MKEFFIRAGIKLGILEYKYEVLPEEVVSSSFCTDNMYSSFLIAKANVSFKMYYEHRREFVVFKKSNRVIKKLPESIHYIVFGSYRFTDLLYYFYDDNGDMKVFSSNNRVTIHFPHEKNLLYGDTVAKKTIELDDIAEKEYKFRYNLTEGDLKFFFRKNAVDNRDVLVGVTRYLQGVIPGVAENELNEFHLKDHIK